MRLTVLGCSGSAPGPAGPASSYLVEHDGFRLLLDLGSGAFGALQRHADPATVDALVLSHLHPDHFLDLSPYVVYRRFGAPEGLPRLPLLGPKGTGDRVASAHDPHVRTGLRDVLDITAVEAGERELGPFRLRFARMVHPVEAYAVRVEAGGRSLTYSGDTAPTTALPELARDTDLLLCEAAWQDGLAYPPGLHLTGREAGEHAVAAGAARLVVTHIPPWADATRIHAEADRAHPGAELAAAGATYDV